jgi:hypothetical protein
MMNSRAANLVTLLLVGVAVPGLPAADKADQDFAEQVYRRVEQIKPPPEKRKWERIPWLTDLTEAVRVAKGEGRPVLLWGSDDPPLLRC